MIFGIKKNLILAKQTLIHISKIAQQFIMGYIFQENDENDENESYEKLL